MEKVTVWSAIRNSFVGIVKPEEHIHAGRLHGARMFALIVLLSLFTSIMLAVSMNKVKDVVDSVWAQLPEFSYANGELNVDGHIAMPFTDNGQNTLFYMDTQSDEASFTDSAIRDMATSTNCSKALFITKTKMTVLENGQVQSVPYSTLFPGGEQINKTNGKPIIYNVINIVLVILAAILFICYIAVFYLSTLIYSLIGLIANAIVKANVDYMQLYKICLSVAFPFWVIKGAVKVAGFSGANQIVKWIVRAAIIIYVVVVLTTKKQQEQDEQLQAQMAAGGAGSMNQDWNSFASNSEIFPDETMNQPYESNNSFGNNYNAGTEHTQPGDENQNNW